MRRSAGAAVIAFGVEVALLIASGPARS